jgi:hypothetical protein
LLSGLLAPATFAQKVEFLVVKDSGPWMLRKPDDIIVQGTHLSLLSFEMEGKPEQTFVGVAHGYFAATTTTRKPDSHRT